MVGIVVGDFMKEAVRQARAIFPHASTEEVIEDLAKIASAAHREAHRQFPVDPHEQQRYVGAKIRAAIRRALGSLGNNRTTI